jgi:hypothetical protein
MEDDPREEGGFRTKGGKGGRGGDDTRVG